MSRRELPRSQTNSISPTSATSIVAFAGNAQGPARPRTIASTAQKGNATVSHRAAPLQDVDRPRGGQKDRDRHGNSVNYIRPGAAAGDRALNVHRQLADAAGRSAEEGETEYRKLEPRFITEEQVAGLAVFLASEEGSRINGQAINIG